MYIIHTNHNSGNYDNYDFSSVSKGSSSSGKQALIGNTLITIKMILLTLKCN